MCIERFGWADLKRTSPPLWLVIAQTVIAFAAIVVGARFFADFVEDFSHAMSFSPLLVSLILAPLATELPEAANSLIWTRDGKDVIALGSLDGGPQARAAGADDHHVVFVALDLAQSLASGEETRSRLEQGQGPLGAKRPPNRW